MDDINYTTGSWLGIVRNGAVVVLEAETAPVIVGQLWNYLGREPTIHGILHEVTGHFGSGLVDLPSFAIILHGERLQAILRGDITLAASTYEGTEFVSGNDVATWSERSLPLPEYLELSLADAPMAGPDMELPVGDAVVRLSSLRMGWIESELFIDDALMDHGGVPGTVPDAPLADGTAWAQPDDAAELARAAHGAEPADWPGHAHAGVAEWDVQMEPLEATGAPADDEYSGAAMDDVPPTEGGPDPEELEDAVPEDAVPEDAEPDDAEQGGAAHDLPHEDQPPLPQAAQPVMPEAGGLVLPPLPSQPPTAGNNFPAPEQEPGPAPEQETELDSAQKFAPVGGDETGSCVEPADDDAPDAQMPENPATAMLQATGTMVLARLCRNGHASPPDQSHCHSCGAATEPELREVGRPSLGRMHISTGEVIDLDHSLIVGRQPSVTQVVGEATPLLVQVTGENGDISRSHVQVRLNGWDVLLADLKATNGTVLVREGREPRRLGRGEEVLLLDGDVAELGGGVSLRFVGLP